MAIKVQVTAPPWLTEEFAAAVRQEPQTLRKHHCQFGHFLGVKPKRIGKRLLWPAADCVRALAGIAEPTS